MRVLAIGLGGSGARIVDQLYDHDQRSRVGCMNAVAIDTDANTLLQLRYLPDTAKIHFPHIDPDQHVDTRSTIDIEEIMTRIQKLDTVEIDAIMIFSGLGGRMVDAIPVIVPELRKSFIEPIFTVVTLPCLNEGKKKAGKAADDLEMLEEFFDGTILFDNETWYRKIRTAYEAEQASSGSRPAGMTGRTPVPDNPRDVYRLLNERIARQVGLMLRAGEFNEEGLEAAEVVLDAGEILNTMKGNGMVAIGYASERLPANWLNLFDRWRSTRYFFEGATQRAARIVALAKQAVYEDISIPCDLTSADKALVLIAGPSKELSFKGFQTVRKWIDRSIAGLEMRSGDYPVKNTRFVAIIVMLSGLHNIPRLEEIRELREEYLVEKELARQKAERELQEQEYDSEETMTGYGDEGQDTLVEEGPKDEMITLSGVAAPKKQAGIANDAIVLNGPKKTEKPSSGIHLPKKVMRPEIDITGTAQGGDRKAPRESTLGLKSININTTAPRRQPDEETGVVVKTLPRAKDGIINGDAISLSPARAPVKEGIINGETVTVGAKKANVREFLDDGDQVRMRGAPGGARDDMFGKAERSLKQAGTRPKEVDPAARRLKVIENKGEPEEGDGGDDIFWIT